MSLPELVLLRAGMPADIGLRPGLLLHGRVLDARTLLLEGARLAAQLPDDVEPGDVLRLRVTEATGDRLHLRIAERVEPPAQQQAAAPAPPVAVPLPGGAHLLVERDGAGDGASGTGGGRPGHVLLRFDAPHLGRLDFRIGQDGIAVSVPAGVPAAHVWDGLPALRERVGVPVSVLPRTGTLDVAA